MSMKKNKLLTLVLLLAALAQATVIWAADADAVNGIRVTTNMKDQSGNVLVYDFLFSTNPKFSYQNIYDNGAVTGQEIVLTSTDVKSRFGQDEIILNQENFEKITFVNANITGVHNVSSESIVFRLAGNHVIEVNGISKGEKISVFSTDGRQLSTIKASSAGSATIELPESESGTIYVVKTGKVSFKVRTK